MNKKKDSWKDRSSSLKTFDKRILSVSQQVSLMESRGMIFSDGEKREALRFLLLHNYYKFAPFYKCFSNKNDKEHIITDCTDKSFGFFKNIYLFDVKLKKILFVFLMELELFLKTQYAYCATTYKNNAHPYSEMFDNYKNVSETIYKCKKAKESPKHQPLKHYFDNYKEEYPPLWTLVETIDFGSLIKLMSHTKDEYLKPNGDNEFGFEKLFEKFGDKKTFVSKLIEIKKLRNKCAHNNPLWHLSKIEEDNSINFKETVKNLYYFLNYFDEDAAVKLKVDFRDLFVGISRDYLSGYDIATVEEFWS